MSKQITLAFKSRNNFWFDSGVLGLYRVIIGKVHATPRKDSEDPQDHLGERFGVEVSLNKEALVLQGPEQMCQDLLEAAFERLLEHYYDVSTKNQWEDTERHNFYYDSKKDRFVSAPKRRAVGLASLLFDKAPVPKYPKRAIKWQPLPKGDKGTRKISYKGREIQKTRRQLPEKLEMESGEDLGEMFGLDRDALQERMDKFLDERGLDSTLSRFLVDGSNVVRPVQKIAAIPKKIKGVCPLCGEENHTFMPLNQTTYILTTGPTGLRSFYSDAGKPPNVCWMCSFLGKFVPVNAFFTLAKKSQRDSMLYSFLPHSPSLTKMDDVYEALSGLANWHDGYCYNFKDNLGGYFSHSQEATFAFFYYVYQRLSQELEQKQESPERNLFRDLMGLLLEDAPLSLAVISAHSAGQSWNVKEASPFTDLAYIFRLFFRIEQGKEKSIPVDKLLRQLVDHGESKALHKTIYRNRILGKVLQKQSILLDVEQFIFHVNSGKPHNSYYLEQFVREYEMILRKEDENFSEMVEVAASLGKQIGMVVGENVVKKKESAGRARGVLYRIRKCRTLGEFINEIGRIQYRYSMSVSNKLYEGGVLTNELFTAFRGFCSIAAMNAYNYRTSAKKKTEGETPAVKEAAA